MKEIIDDVELQNSVKVNKFLWTIRFLIVGGGIIFATFIFAIFWIALGLDENDTIWLGLSMILSFGINFAGLIIGFIELKTNRKRALIGVIGNLLLILFFVSIVLYSIA